MARREVQRRTRPDVRARPLPRGAWALTEAVRLPPIESVKLEDLRECARQSNLVFEPLLAGARVLVARTKDSVAILTEAKRSLTRELEGLVRTVAASAALPEVFIAEGLLVALDPTGRPSLEALRRSLVNGSRDVLLILRDVLRVGDEDVSRQSYAARRAHLTQWSGLPPAITVMTCLGEDFELARRAMGDVRLDGLVARPSGAASADSVCLVARAQASSVVPVTSLSPAPQLTNATKVLFPRDGFAKQDLFSYYREVAPVLLPLVSQRPVVLQRWPDGIDEFRWYQHRVPPRAPDYLRVMPIEGNRRIAIDNLDALLWLVNQAAITFHGFVSRELSLQHPDWIVLDLDPPDEGAWARVVAVALAIRKLLELIEVESIVKTSGQKGLHILIPLAPRQDAGEVKLAAGRIADLIERLLPSDTTQETDREKRRGRVLLDANQGFVGKTLVLPYSVRGVDGAPVSTPLRWDEVTPSLSPRAFGMRAMCARLEREGDLASGLLTGRAEVGRVLARLAQG